MYQAVSLLGEVTEVYDPHIGYDVTVGDDRRYMNIRVRLFGDPEKTKRFGKGDRMCLTGAHFTADEVGYPHDAERFYLAGFAGFARRIWMPAPNFAWVEDDLLTATVLGRLNEVVEEEAWLKLDVTTTRRARGEIQTVNFTFDVYRAEWLEVIQPFLYAGRAILGFGVIRCSERYGGPVMRDGKLRYVLKVQSLQLVP